MYRLEPNLLCFGVIFFLHDIITYLIIILLGNSTLMRLLPILICIVIMLYYKYAHNKHTS